MPVIPTPEGVDFSNFYDSFIKGYPNRTVRLSQAIELVGGPEKLGSYPSHKVVAAHWAEDNDALRTIGQNQWDTKHNMGAYEKHPVIVIKKGSVDDVKSDEEWLDHEVDLEFGHIAGDALGLVFGGNATSRGGRLAGVKPPFLTFGTRLPVTDRTRIQHDVVGSGEITRLDGTEIPIYGGVIPLTDDVELYTRQRVVQERTIIFGKKLCTEFFEHLEAKGLEGLSYRVDLELAA